MTSLTSVPSSTSPTTTTSTSSSSSQKRRKYSTRACVFCRNRHKKCDGGQPCMACDQRKQDCVYPEQQKKRGPKPRSSLLHGGVVGGAGGGLLTASSSPALTGHSSHSHTQHPNHGTHHLGHCIISAVDFGSVNVNVNANPTHGAVGTSQHHHHQQHGRHPREMVGVVNPHHHHHHHHHPVVGGVNGVVQPEKTKRRKLSSNSEERLTNVRQVNIEGPSMEQINLCHSLKEILQLIQQQPHAYPFLQPVRITDAPDYYEIINQPMDFRTISKKINAYQYVTLGQFYNDLNLLVDNCRKYNQGTRSAYLIDWAIELQNLCLEELQKRTTETLFWCPPIDPVEQFENYRANGIHEINDFYEIDPRYQEEYDPSLLTTPLEHWSIFGYYDLLENNNYLCAPVYGEDTHNVL